MFKIMQDEFHSERRDIEEWCRKHGVNAAARDELLRILYGKALTKGDKP